MGSYYDKHCDNLKMIETAISSIEVSLKQSIRKQDQQNVDIYTRILAFLINSWTEVRIIKLLNESNAFSDVEIKNITKNSLENKWKQTLKKAYDKSFPNTGTDPENEARLNALMDIITDHLKYSADIRNKLAHGQWIHSFDRDSIEYDNILTSKVNDENYLKINFRYLIFKDLSQMIHDLAVSTPTFERDFERLFLRVVEKQNQSKNMIYEKFVHQLVSKEMKSRQIREANKCGTNT
ncbi:hypothetical protein [Methanolobus vulcani]|uniref:RiboL-PSP-HEPN domain-containing protein n=1 Tax=Methanolobus vulcani TaxID=38026 RepID=A0A7Z8KP86_9EURY|nr:hypothetical protein [Methanolobus vulcani]TQD23510.1 hypothetical protein FKV42_13375 [Methanolobus vulcani]